MTTLTAQPIIAPLAIPARKIGDDIAVYVSPDVILISSRSTPNSFRLVNLVERTCSCESFTYRGSCHHLATAAAAEEMERASAEPVTLPTCPKCGVRRVAVICERVMSTCCRCAIDLAD